MGRVINVPQKRLLQTLLMNKTLSRIAHIASLSCVLHCIITPFIVLFLPILGDSCQNIWIELGLLFFSILIGVFIIYTGYCSHKKVHSCILFGIGALFWTVNILFEYLDILHIHDAHVVLLSVGTGFILLSYYLNHRFSSCCVTSSSKND